MGSRWIQILLLLILTKGTSAGLFIEPTVGYTIGDVSQSGIPEISLQSIIFGGRLGINFARFQLGGEASLGFGTSSQIGNSGDYKPIDMGGFIGYEFPLHLILYGSVFPFSKAKIQSDENPADFSGLSFRAGLGWSGLGFCAIYFEGTYRSYSSYNGVQMTKAIQGITLGGSVSIPIP